MNVTGSAANLAQAMKELRLEWERAQTYWRDAKSEQFAHKYLEQLPNDVSRTTVAIKEISVLLNKVRTDCE